VKTKRVLIFLLIFAAVGYLREYFFVNLNNIMFLKYYGHTTLPIPAVMNSLQTYSYKTLYYGKYLFTLLWIALFYLTGYFAIKKLSAANNLTRFFTYSYLVLLILATLSMGIGLLINNRLQDGEYIFSRWLLGIAQSPAMCFIILASQKLSFNNSIKNSNKN
jgi:hypothetical protein